MSKGGPKALEDADDGGQNFMSWGGADNNDLGRYTHVFTLGYQAKSFWDSSGKLLQQPSGWPPHLHPFPIFQPNKWFLTNYAAALNGSGAPCCQEHRVSTSASDSWDLPWPPQPVLPRFTFLPDTHTPLQPARGIYQACFWFVRNHLCWVARSFPFPPSFKNSGMCQGNSIQ